MPDPTPPTPAPAHPWRKTVRTVIATVLAAAALAAPVYEAATEGNAEAATGYAAIGLAVAAALTRIMALPGVNSLLGSIGLGHDDVETNQVLALVIPEAEAPARIVAGELAPQPTGTPLPANTTVRQLTPPDLL